MPRERAHASEPCAALTQWTLDCPLQLFHYSFTTAPPLDFEQTLPALPDTLAGHEIMPMSGLGCGLPIARVYAGFLGGALELHTMHHYGTDVYYRLKRTAEDQLENLI